MGKSWGKDGKKVESDVKGGKLVETRNMEWKRSGKEVGKGWKEDGIK